MAAEETMERTDLSDLVRTRMDEKGLGLRTLAAASVDPKDPGAGPQWTRGTLDNLTKGVRIKAPTEEQLRSLVEPLGVPMLALQRAAANSASPKPISANASAATTKPSTAGRPRPRT